MNKPTDEEIEKAKEFIRERMAAQDSVRNNTKKYMLAAALAIIKASSSYRRQKNKFSFYSNGKLNDNIDAILSDMKAKIKEAVLILSVADKKEKADEIEDYVLGEKYGKTFGQRNQIYSNRFKYEVEAILASGYAFGLSDTQIYNKIVSYIQNPYLVPEFKKAVEQGDFQPTRIETDGISYGKGQYQSSFNSFMRLTDTEVAMAWMFWLYNDMKNRGAVGFISYRGSTYDCIECDMQRGYHPITDEGPMYHSRCKCYMVPVYSKEDIPTEDL